jgi:predicted CXXCH cytochrome family protein
MKKGKRVILFLFISIIFSVGYALALDPPHDPTSNPLEPVTCISCHVLHNAPGTSLTNNASNANLCMSCHVDPGGWASEKPFNINMEADPIARIGYSHAWSGTMPGSSLPDNQYGLRSPADSAMTPAIETQLTKFSNVATCSCCHQQHNQANGPWDPFAPAYGGAGTGNGRHFQRITNDINQMCIDCHYYRDTNVSSDPSSARYQVWNGNKRSHPVNVIFSSAQGETPNVNYTTQFNTAPREPESAGWAAQTDAVGVYRYKQNGAPDTNLTNNIVLDASANVKCLSCHGVHYTDSDSTTVDGP